MIASVRLSIGIIMLAVPRSAMAQATTADSTAITQAIAASILLDLRDGGGYRGPVTFRHPQAYEAREWTLRVAAVVARTAPELIADPQSRVAMTLELNAVSVAIDSVIVHAAFSQCMQSRGGMNYWRASTRFTIRRINGQLTPTRSRTGSIADGSCNADSVHVPPPQVETDRFRAQVLGCYLVERGPWDKSLPSAPLGVYDVPSKIRLDSAHTSVRTWPDSSGRQAHPQIPSVHTAAHPREGFWFVDRDTLSVEWTDGYVTSLLVVGVRGESLSGDAAVLIYNERMGATTLTGATPPIGGATASVRLRRTPCGSFDAAPREDSRELPLANEALLLQNARVLKRLARLVGRPQSLLGVHSGTPAD